MCVHVETKIMPEAGLVDLQPCVGLWNVPRPYNRPYNHLHAAIQPLLLRS